MLLLLPHLSRLSPPSISHRSASIAAAAMHSNSSPTPTQTHKDSDLPIKVKEAITYHNRTKHSLTSGYARGPMGLDWANQPNPFLKHLSSPNLPLPFDNLDPQPHDSPFYPSLFSSFPSPPQPLSASFISRLLYDSLALSAWKSTGFSTWSLRVNPSSGNLHPTETHVFFPPISALSTSPVLAHYLPKTHSMECRAELPLDFFPNDECLFLAFSSVFWREAWKYGERALRYCNHDVGHAIAAVAVAAAALGWDVRLLDGFGHDELNSLLGFEKLYPPMPNPLPERPIRGKIPWVEAQHPDCLLVLFPFGTEISVDYLKMRDFATKFGSLNWVGMPNALSKDHVCWDVIYKTAEAIKKPFTGDKDEFFVNEFRPSGLISEDSYANFTVREIVRKRRSAVDMDGVHVMERDTFYQILLHCLPSGDLGGREKQGKQCALPFRVLTWDAEVHAALFVHKVKDLPKGLYFLVRNEEHLDRLKKTMRPEFEWVKPEGCPAGLTLYRLARGNCERLAKQLSCHQVCILFKYIFLFIVQKNERSRNESVTIDGWVYNYKVYFKYFYIILYYTRYDKEECAFVGS